MRNNFERPESDADRLRRRLQERNARINKYNKPKLSPFTLISILIILVVLFLVRGGS
ncbi:MAG: hypothetical protein FWC67_02305 [Defluviitaleaceae bacterium]|nr:hypothetical protein [Defluviitaleaceae bacterium]